MIKKCEAQTTRGGDQIECIKCGLIWDRDDDDPPICPELMSDARIDHA